MHVLGIAALLLAPAAGHITMTYPPPREASMVNGVVMGAQNTDQANNDREFVVEVATFYKDYACGGTGRANLVANVELAKSRAEKPFQFDTTIQPQGSTSFTAGAEVDVGLQGYIHPGTIRIAMCFQDKGEDCNDLASYEKHILGYWWTQGTSSTSSDIYSAAFTVRVKIPMLNSGRAIFQMLHDAHDGRSYVQCADVTTSGAAAESDVTVCNGHPFCNCDPDQSTSKSYGLGGKCPSGLEGAYDDWPQFASIGKQEFCNLCVSESCPTHCGGPNNGVYNGDNTIGGSHSNDLPRYTDCPPGGCQCPGCQWTTFTPGTGGGNYLGQQSVGDVTLKYTYNADPNTLDVMMEATPGSGVQWAAFGSSPSNSMVDNNAVICFFGSTTATLHSVRDKSPSMVTPWSSQSALSAVTVTSTSCSYTVQLSAPGQHQVGSSAAVKDSSGQWLTGVWAYSTSASLAYHGAGTRGTFSLDELASATNGGNNPVPTTGGGTCTDDKTDCPQWAALCTGAAGECADGVPNCCSQCGTQNYGNRDWMLDNCCISCSQASCAADGQWPQRQSGQTATQSCPVGQSGSRSRTCDRGAWTAVQDTCATTNTCPAEQGFLQTAAGQTASATCAAGYNGSKTRTCSSTGVWGSVTDNCVPATTNTCPAEQGFPQTSAGQTASATCAAGYNGSKTRSCSSDGVWGSVTDNCTPNSNPTTCEDAPCATEVCADYQSNGVCAQSFAVTFCAKTCGLCSRVATAVSGTTAVSATASLACAVVLAAAV